VDYEYQPLDPNDTATLDPKSLPLVFWASTERGKSRHLATRFYFTKEKPALHPEWEARFLHEGGSGVTYYLISKATAVEIDEATKDAADPEAALREWIETRAGEPCLAFHGALTWLADGSVDYRIGQI
jgi:hypothetical protein